MTAAYLTSEELPAGGEWMNGTADEMQAGDYLMTVRGLILVTKASDGCLTFENGGSEAGYPYQRSFYRPAPVEEVEVVLTGLRVHRFPSEYASSSGPFGSARHVTVVGIVDHRYPADLSKREVQPLPEDERGPFVPSEDAPAAVLVYRNMGETQLVHVEPLTVPAGETHTPWMSGGGYAGTTDSRWSRLIGFYGAASVHDYCETWQRYNEMD